MGKKEPNGSSSITSVDPSDGLLIWIEPEGLRP
jgi:hypothetical protein